MPNSSGERPNRCIRNAAIPAMKYGAYCGIARTVTAVLPSAGPIAATVIQTAQKITTRR